MRFTAVELVRYGHLSDTRIDLGDPSKPLHVIYGLNEAGKTTVKSAIEDLLFGMAGQTPYGFKYGYSALRLTASLANCAGETLSFTRIKANTNSLLSGTGTPLAQDALSPFLRGMNRNGFCSQFSLTRDDMAKGSQDIVDGKGELGANLYNAALGNTSLPELIKRLEEQAKKIFTPQGKVMPLNRALSLFVTAKANLKEALIRPRDWEAKVREQAVVVAQIAAVDEQIGVLAVFVGLSERLRAQAQTYDRVIGLRVRLAERAHEIVPPQESIDACEKSLTLCQKGVAFVGAANERIEDLTRRQGSHEESLLLAHGPAIHEMTCRVGAYTTGLDDLKRLNLRDEAIRNGTEARQLLDRVWPGLDLEIASNRVVPQVTLARGNVLALSYMTLTADSATAHDSKELLLGRVTDIKADMNALAPIPDVTALRAMIATATLYGRLDTEASRAHSQVGRQQQNAEAKLSALGLFTGSLTALAQAPLPLPETIARFKSDFETLLLEEKVTKERRDDAMQKLSESVDKLELLAKQGPLQTVNDLAQARTSRDAIFESLGHQWRAEASIAELDSTADCYRPTVAGADDLADELRRKSERVARIAQMQDQREIATEAMKEYDAALAAAAVRRASLLADWVAVWRNLKIAPHSPGEMGSWLSQALEVRRLVDVLGEARANWAECVARRTSLVALLRSALAEVGGTAPEGEMLEPVLSVAKDLLAKFDIVEGERTKLNRDLMQGKREISRQEKKYSDAQSKLAIWRESWRNVLEMASLSRELVPAAFADTVALIERFHKADRDARSGQSRADGIARDSDRFRTDVLSFVAEFAPDLELIAQTSPNTTVETLDERLTAAQSTHTQREERQRLLEAEQQNIAKAQCGVDAAEAVLMQTAQDFAIEREALASLLARSKETVAMRREFASGREELETAIGLPLDGCEREYRGRDRAEIDRALGVAREQERELRVQRDGLIATRLELDSVLAGMDTSQLAVDAEADLIAIGATIDRESRAWVEVSLARHILDEQVREYTEQHQGPLIERSGDYFNKLTAGAYTTLRAVAAEKKNVLEAIDRTGHGTPADDLSDGTRDQLYFALRLAALEEYFKANEAQPVILDDVFVAFDDIRTELAFAALAEFSRSTQVLYFTHHRACVDAAVRAVPANLLAVHELAPHWTTIN